MKKTQINRRVMWICTVAWITLCTGYGAEEPVPQRTMKHYKVHQLVSPRVSADRTITPFGNLLLVDGDNGSAAEAFCEHVCQQATGFATVAPASGWGDLESVVDWMHMEEYNYEYFQGSLWVDGPLEMHDRLKTMLNAFHVRALERIRIECLLVPLETLEAAVPGWRDEAPWLPSSAFHKLLANDASTLYSAEAYNGQLTELGAGGRRRFMDALAVNQTGVSPVQNPRIRSLAEGIRIEVNPMWSPMQSGVRLDLGFQSRALSGRQTRISKDLPVFELPGVKESCLWSSAFVPKNKVFVMAGLSGGVVDKSVALLIRTEPIGSKVIARSGRMITKADGYTISLFDLPVQFRKVPYEVPIFSLGLTENLPYSPSPGDEDERPSRPDEERAEAFQSLLDDLVIQASEEDGEISRCHHVFMISTPDATMLRAVEAFFRQYQAAPAMTFASLKQVTVPRALFVALNQQLDNGNLLPSDWRSRLAKNAVSMECLVSGLAGQLVSVRRVDGETIIDGVDSVSGGTTYTLTELISIHSRDVASGFAAEIRVRPVPGSAMVTFECCGIQSTTDTSRNHDVIMNQCKPGLTSTPVQLTLNTPQQKAHTWRINTVLPQKRDALLDVEMLEDGNVRLLIGNVRMVKP